MVYAYIRVSTDKQTTENQRYEINRFASSRNLVIEKWVEETISSRKDLEERAFGKLLKKLRQDDMLIVAEISRMGRNLMQIMSILNQCMERNVKVFAIKEGYELGDNISSKILAFAFGLSAEIERSLISQRTREALARRKAEGQKLGPKFGSKKKNVKLAQHSDFIRERLAAGATQIEIARSLKVCRQTVGIWMKEHSWGSEISMLPSASN